MINHLSQEPFFPPDYLKIIFFSLTNSCMPAGNLQFSIFSGSSEPQTSLQLCILIFKGSKKRSEVGGTTTQF